MPISYKGYDLYIKNANGQWQYAASGSLKAYKGEKTETFTLIENMDGTMHECMMYMPMYSEVISCKIGIDDDAVIEPLKSDFRHRIAIYGSSFTQGVSTDRSGMSYPMQFMQQINIRAINNLYLHIYLIFNRNPYFFRIFAAEIFCTLLSYAKTMQRYNKLRKLTKNEE